MTHTIKDIENETFTISETQDISNLSAIMSSPLMNQADDSNLYFLDRVLDGRKTAERIYQCVKVNGEFVKVI